MKYRKSLFNKTAFVLFENKMKLKDAYFGRDEYGNSIIVRSTEDLNGKVKKIYWCSRVEGGENQGPWCLASYMGFHWADFSPLESVFFSGGCAAVAAHCYRG